MNKQKILIILITIFTNQLIGQETVEYSNSIFKLGLNAGPNSNSLRGDSFAEKYGSQFNYFIGLSFEYKINDDFSVLTNVNYENKSYKAEYNGFSQVWSNTTKILDKTKFKMINIPVLLKYKFGFDKEFHLNGGVFYNHYFDVSNEMINTETNENISDLDFNELFKDKEYGISLGIGMTYKLNEKNNLEIEVRDDFGLSDIGDTEFGNISISKTNTIKLIVNWSLNL